MIFSEISDKVGLERKNRGSIVPLYSIFYF